MGPDLGRMIVGGNYDFLRSKLACPAFDFSCKWKVVGPYFKVVTDPGMFRAKVIKEHGLRILIAVEPLVKALVIELRIVLSDGAALSRTRWSIKPEIVQLW